MRSKKKVVFLCSSVERVQDGVGDYLIRFCDGLSQLSFDVTIIGLNDKFIDKTEVSAYNGIKIVRYSHKQNWNSRLLDFRAYIINFRPDIISFHFVIFGFHKKGLPFFKLKKLAKFIGSMKCRKEIMFHETWVRWNEETSLKLQILGRVQKIIVMNLVRKSRWDQLYTSNTHYQSVLARSGINTKILPLFSNIKKNDSEIHNYKYLKSIFKDDTFKVCFFSRVPFLDTETVNTFIEILLKCEKEAKKKVVIYSFGRVDKEKAKLLFEKFKTNNFKVYQLGEKSEIEISFILNACDVGIFMYDEKLIGRSGVVAAYREHSLPFIVLDSISSYKSTLRERDYLFLNEFHSFTDINKCNTNLGFSISAVIEKWKQYNTF